MKITEGTKTSTSCRQLAKCTEHLHGEKHHKINFTKSSGISDIVLGMNSEHWALKLNEYGVYTYSDG